MRPILLATDTYNYPLAKLMARREIEALFPLVSTQLLIFFYFTNEIHELKINKSEILVSYDVSSLFTKVPVDQTIAILVNGAFTKPTNTDLLLR